MNYKEIIEKRQSTRDFCDKKVSDDITKHLEDFFKKVPRLTDDDIELKIFKGEDISKKLQNVAGYMGHALNAPMYIILLGKKTDNNLIGAGFIGMNLVLEMTNNDMATCFIDANNSDGIKKALEIKGDKDVLTVIAAGYKEETKKQNRIDIKNITHVKVVERKGYSAPKISVDDMVYFEKWGNSFENNDPILEQSFYAASLSPYFMNRQNYRYIVRENEIILCDKDDEMISAQDRFIGLGCTMFNFYAMCSDYLRGDKNWVIGETTSLDLPDGYKSYAKFTI